MRHQNHHGLTTGRGRRAGIALLVVMVVFVVLYLVVTHLAYWTKMEEHAANVRLSDGQTHDGVYGAMLFVVNLLVEDLKKESGGAMLGAGGAATGRPAPAPGPGGKPPTPTPDSRGRSQSNMVPNPPVLPGAANAPVAHFDYPRENIFNDVRQTIGNVEVKARIIDNESRIDLNQLFEYPPLIFQGKGETGLGVTDDDLLGAVEGAGDESEAAENLRAVAEEGKKILAGRAARGYLGTARAGADGGRRGAGRARRRGDKDAEEDPEVVAKLGLQDELDLTEFFEPTPEIISAARDMLSRAVQALIDLNLEREFEYLEVYDPGEVANNIVDYVLIRRRSLVQNVIYHPTELLNIFSITPELYYGPQPPAEEFYVDDFFTQERVNRHRREDDEAEPKPSKVIYRELILDDGTVFPYFLRRDEFGDLVADRVEDDPDILAEQEEQQAMLHGLQETFGEFMDFGGIGNEIGRLAGSPLTRGMTEPPVVYDEYGDGFVVVPPVPMGLKDIFCTFSTGQINLNTAPLPVLFALLISGGDFFSEARAGRARRGGIDDEDAYHVAYSIDRYRNRLQEQMDNDDATEDIARAPNLGQPRRQRRDEDEFEDEDYYNKVADYDIYDQQGPSYEDLETNYFTDLRQIELVDGTEEDADDLLRNDAGVERVTGDQENLLLQVINNLSNVTVFGSTYFSVELKAKSKMSPLVKSGYLVLKRDTTKRLMEVILWKEVE